MRLAHISDVHLVSALSSYLQVRNFKQLIGLFNWIMYRRNKISIRKVYNSVDMLVEKNIDALVVTGDISQLACSKDYEIYARIMQPLTSKNIPVITIKGNHDHYSTSSKLSLAFDKFIKPLSLNTEVEPGVYRVKGVELFHLEGAVPTPPFKCWGKITSDGLKDIERRFKKYAKSTAQKVAFGHFPLLGEENNSLPAYMALRGADKVLQLLDKYKVSNYLCGHIHKPFANLLPNNIQQFCSGSISASGLIRLFDIAPDNIVEISSLKPAQ